MGLLSFRTLSRDLPCGWGPLCKGARMYLDYDAYRGMWGTIPEETYGDYESEAEMMLDHWTLGRLHSEQVVSDLKSQGLYGSVGYAMKAIIDRLDSIHKARQSLADGTVVTSFSNGVDSFGFGGDSSASSVTAAERECMERVMELLPVDLASACVGFNGAM